jgi:APA family basic amino acid/polyamine antiporter
LFCLIAIALLIPGFFTTGFFSDLGALYVFGSLLCFALAHAAIIALRVKKPDMPRPFKLRLNFKIKGRELPTTAVLGFAATFIIWIVMLVTQPYSRMAGLVWMAVGLVIYGIFRWRRRLHSNKIAGAPPGFTESQR